MAMARADGMSDGEAFQGNRFYSMSAQIEAECKTYYQQLERQQRNSVDITGWLDWFLDCLGRAISTAETMLSAVLYKAELWKIANRYSVNDRQRLILNKMLDGFKGYMNTSKYAKLTKCSTDTALRDIRNLLLRGLLVQNPGGGRSTSYRLPDFEELKELTE
jgi:Fic family protein